MSWNSILEEARAMRARDSFLADTLDSHILFHKSFSSAVAYMLAEQFAGDISREKWFSLFTEVMNRTNKYHQDMDTLERMGLFDLAAVKERDPSCEGLVNPFLYFKGFKALQSHRAAHWLWINGRQDTARAIQSRCSELYDVDIHPGARIGKFFG